MASTIPAVLDVLMQSWGLALPGVQVVEGQPVDLEPDIVCLAFTGIAGAPAIEATEDRGGLSGSDREKYDVTCVASSLKGETDTRLVRERVFEMVEAIRGDLRRDPTLGGLALSARMAVLGVATEQTEDGAAATVQFAVRIDAFAT